ncbi:MAG: sortase family protein [uncultured bacterium]|nr:MAG: sortase family protein [uncultured bacterium]
MDETNNNKLDQSWTLKDTPSASQSVGEIISVAPIINNKPVIDSTIASIKTVTFPTVLPPVISNLEPIKTRNFFKEILKAASIFIGCFIFIYLFLTFPAYWAKGKYYWDKTFNKTTSTLNIPQSLDQTQGDILISALTDALEKSPDRTINKKKYTIDISDLENNYLIIPKIPVKAPIIWNVAPDQDLMLKRLQDGLVHYNGTALPDGESGNIFVSGHSSYYWWDKGNYKTIFANLDKLNNGDEIALAYNDKVYVYKVIDKVVVKPEQVEVLDQTDKPILSLMTCVPLGTNLKRLIVKAERLQITSPKEEQEQNELQKLEEIKKKAQESTPTQNATQTAPTQNSKQEKNPIEMLPWVN